MGRWAHTASVGRNTEKVTMRCRHTPKETESRSCGVNVAVCLAALEERTLHQLQLRPKRLMGKTAQQESEVRRPHSARANWSLWPELTPTSLWRNTYTCMEQLWQESSIKHPTDDQGGFCCDPGHQSVLCGPASPPSSHLQWQLGRASQKRLPAFDLKVSHFGTLLHFCAKVRSKRFYKGNKPCYDRSSI